MIMMIMIMIINDDDDDDFNLIMQTINLISLNHICREPC